VVIFILENVYRFDFALVCGTILVSIDISIILEIEIGIKPRIFGRMKIYIFYYL
jgi:hypothetical protein